MKKILPLLALGLILTGCDSGSSDTTVNTSYDCTNTYAGDGAINFINPTNCNVVLLASNATVHVGSGSTILTLTIDGDNNQFYVLAGASIAQIDDLGTGNTFFYP